MVESLIQWSLRNRVLVVILALAVSIAGAWLGSKMPVDVLPDLTAPTVTVITEGTSLSPEEMETQVTIPIEGALNGAHGVRRVRSGTALGLSVVWVEFDWDTPMSQARQTVSERLLLVADRMPPQANQPKLAPASSIMGEVLFFAVVSEPHDDLALRTTAQTIVRRRLLTLSGVSQVSVLGGSVPQFQIVLSPEALLAYGLDASAVVEALEATNSNLSGGVIVDGPRELVIEAMGRVRTVDELASTVVALRQRRSIRVSDLGVIRVGAAARRGSAASATRNPDGTARIEDAVILAVQKQPGTNTLALTQELDRALDDIEDQLPSGMWLRRDLFRQASFIERSVENTGAALVEGAAMVVLVVLMFLASLRTSLLTLVVLPVSVLTTTVVLYFFGGINTMTLGGLAIAIGALVDDAIIDVENIVRRLRENHALSEEQRKPVLAVICSASVEVRASIVLATAIILLAFLPLFFLSGIEGRLLLPLGMAFCISLSVSLLVALTLTPALAAWFLPDTKAISSAGDSRLVIGIKRLYQPVLDWSLKRPAVLAGLGACGLVAAGLGLARTGTGFLPEFNEGALVIGAVTEPGTSLDQSIAIAKLVDQALMRQPEIVALGRRTGRAEEDEHVQGVEASEIDLTLDLTRPERIGLKSRTKDELLEALRADLAAVPGIQATIGQPIGHRIDHMLSGTRAGIAIKLYGRDLSEMRAYAAQVQKAIRVIPGVVDVSAEQQAMVPSLRIVPDRERLALHGLRVEDANKALALGTTGIRAGTVLDVSDAWDIVVRTADVESISADDLLRLGICKDDGSLVSLGAVSTLHEDRVPNFVSREGLERKFVVSCNAQGRDLGSVLADIQQVIDREIPKRQGIRIEYGGQFESAQSTRTRLLILGVSITLLVMLLLLWMFRSMRDTLLILANMPLALIGAVAGVWLSGGVLTVASMIGFITVFGIAVRNGIMLVSHIRHLQDSEGLTDLHDAVRRAALERLAPILMTAMAAGLALVPLALRRDQPGNEILSPMAIVILCGLLSSTLLNMLLVPSFYLRWGRASAGWRMPRPSVPALALVAVGFSGMASCQSTPRGPDWSHATTELNGSVGVAIAPDAQLPAGDDEFLAALEGGLTLQEAMRLSLLRSPRLRAAFHSVGASQGEFEEAQALRNPRIALGWLFPAGGERSQWTLDLLQPLADAWVRPARVRLALVDQREALLELSATAREIVCTARAAWLEAAKAASCHEIAESELRLADKRLKAVTEQVELGVANEQELRSEQLRLMQITLDVEAAELRHRQANRALASSLHWSAGSDLAAFVVAEEPLPAAAPLSELVRAAMSSRLDLRMSELAVDRAESELELARHGRWSSVEIGVSVERPAVSGSTLIGPAASIEIPLSDRKAASVFAAEQHLAERIAQREDVLARAVLEIEQLVKALNETEAQYMRATGVVMSAEERSLQTLREAVAHGDATLQAQLAAERSVLETRRRLEAARWASFGLHLQLEEAVGSPLVQATFTTPAPEPRGP